MYFMYPSHWSWVCHHQSPFQEWSFPFCPKWSWADQQQHSQHTQLPARHLQPPLLGPLGRDFCSTSLAVFLTYLYFWVGKATQTLKPPLWGCLASRSELPHLIPASALPSFISLIHTCCLQPVLFWNTESIPVSLDLCIFLLQFNLK